STWALLVTNLDTAGHDAEPGTVTVLTSGDTPSDLILRNPGGMSARWGADDTLVFLSYRDGFPHLYSLRHPGEKGSRPLLLTPGSFMVEHVALSPDGRTVVYNANTGTDRSDFDRRHLFRVPIDAATPVPLTGGLGIAWSPAVLADGRSVAFVTSD